MPSKSGSWTAPYKEIRRANLIIEGVTASSLSDAEKEDYIAQARMYRARQYYTLVRSYGDVPLVTEVLDPTSDAPGPLALLFSPLHRDDIGAVGDMPGCVDAEAVDTHLDKARVALYEIVGHGRVLGVEVHAVTGYLAPPA